MIQELTSSEVVEQEFRQLQQDLHQNLHLIEDLTKIEDKFSTLAKTYQDIRQFVPTATSTLGFLQTQVSEGLTTVHEGKQEVYAELQKLQEVHARSLQELHVTFEQEQLQLHNLHQQVQQSMTEIQQQHKALAMATQEAKQQFETATQAMHSHQNSLQKIEKSLRSEFNSLESSMEHKLRRQQIYSTILLLLLIGLCGYIAIPALTILLN